MRTPDPIFGGSSQVKRDADAARHSLDDGTFARASHHEGDGQAKHDLRPSRDATTEEARDRAFEDRGAEGENDSDVADAPATPNGALARPRQATLSTLANKPAA
jgi:hypothetical protein